MLFLIEADLAVLETAVRIVVFVNKLVHSRSCRVEVPQQVIRRIGLLVVEHHGVRLEERVQVVIFLIGR